MTHIQTNSSSLTTSLITGNIEVTGIAISTGSLEFQISHWQCNGNTSNGLTANLYCLFVYHANDVKLDPFNGATMWDCSKAPRVWVFERRKSSLPTGLTFPMVRSATPMGNAWSDCGAFRDRRINRAEGEFGKYAGVHRTVLCLF